MDNALRAVRHSERKSCLKGKENYQHPHIPTTKQDSLALDALLACYVNSTTTGTGHFPPLAGVAAAPSQHTGSQSAKDPPPVRQVPGARLRPALFTEPDWDVVVPLDSNCPVRNITDRHRD